MIAGSNSENLLLVIATERRGADVLTTVRKELGDLGVGAKDAGVAIGAGAQAGIREIEKLSRTIDVSSKKDVVALRASAAAVREMAQAAGVAPAEVQKLSVAEAVLAARLKAATQEARAQAAQITGLGGRMEVMSPKVRTAANAMSVLSMSATGFGGSAQSSIMAAGNLATSLASLSTSAALAAGATGVGAIAIVLGTIIGLMRSTKVEAADLSGTLDLIRSVGSAAEAGAVSRNIEQQLADARRKLKEFNSSETVSRAGRPAVAGDVVGGVMQFLDARKVREERAHIEAEIAGLMKVSADAYKSYVDALGQEGQRAGERAKALAEAASKRVQQMIEQDAKAALETRQRLSVAVLDIELARDNDIYTQRRLKIERAYSEEIEKLKALEIADARRLAIQQQAFQVRNRSLEVLAEEQRLMRDAFARENRMTSAAMRGDVKGSFEGRVEDIERQAELDLKAGNTKEEVERRTQLRIRQLQKDTLRATVGDLKTIEEATINSKNRQIRAIGMAAMVLRKLEIGAEASRAAVESARAFGKVPGYLAAHQYGSAALSAASGVQLAAAAALGFREALGGGGGGSGSGAGGGGGGSGEERNAFTPNAQPTGAGAPIIINLITRNPYGRDEIQNAIFEINRAGVLKRPGIEINLPPTTGIRSA